MGYNELTEKMFNDNWCIIKQHLLNNGFFDVNDDYHIDNSSYFISCSYMLVGYGTKYNGLSLKIYKKYPYIRDVGSYKWLTDDNNVISGFIGNLIRKEKIKEILS